MEDENLNYDKKIKKSFCDKAFFDLFVKVLDLLVTIEIIIKNNYSFDRDYQVTKFTFKPLYDVHFLNAYEERRKKRIRNCIIKNDQKLDWQYCVCGVYLFCFPRVEVKTLE